ncbi:hypothetical protein Ancab_040023 [Ancistrocladus abbreviatus]
MDVCKTLIHLFLLWIFTHYLLFALKRSKFSPKRLPPGPLPLPIVGNLFHLGSKPHKTFTKLAKVYGPLFTVELGYVTTVIISSAAMAKEILQKQDVCFSNRNPSCAVSALNHYESSLVMMPPNSEWRNFRKICNSNIFSVSRLDASQGLRRKKVQQLLSYVEDYCKSGNQNVQKANQRDCVVFSSSDKDYNWLKECYICWQ